MADVWIIYMTIEYTDGSSKQFISSVYRDRASAERSLGRRETRNTNVRTRRSRDGEKIVKDSSWEIANWMVI